MAELLATLAARGVRLSLGSNGRIRFEAPAGALSPTLRDAITSNREALLSALQAPGPSVEEPTPHPVIPPDAEASDPRPYLTPAGTLVIPFDAPARFYWWADGQSIAETLAELGAPPEVLRAYDPNDGRTPGRLLTTAEAPVGREPFSPNTCELGDGSGRVPNMHASKLPYRIEDDQKHGRFLVTVSLDPGRTRKVYRYWTKAEKDKVRDEAEKWAIKASPPSR